MKTVWSVFREHIRRRMTKKELALLEIAKQTIELNKDCGAKLSGSLMLALRGLHIRREANDIDIICDFLSEKGAGLPSVPQGFKQSSMEGRKSSVEAIQYFNSDGVKLEFMQSKEPKTVVEGVPCGSLSMLLLAKRGYSKNDQSPESKTKHEKDLKYLLANNRRLLFKMLQQEAETKTNISHEDPF